MKTNGSMNRHYRLVWSQVQQACIAVAETTRGRGKQSGVVSSAATAVLGAASLGLLLLGAQAQAAPQGGQVSSGSASITQSGTTTTIAQTSQNASLSWQRFNVGASETVNFVQPSASAIAVNRIYDTQGSQILGRINANGQVWLINPNGVLFGRDAQINVGGLVASTLDVADGDLASTTRRFAGSSSASVVNMGRITAAPGGYVSLLGHQVINQGSISAQLGTVALGAGSAISLNFSGSRLLGLQVEQSALNALAENGGLIQAAGGQVGLSAGARDSLLASVVNNTGVIEATTVQEQGGTIVLLAGMAAGTTNVGGTLDASAPQGGNGGFIETSAHSVHVADGAKITTLATKGRTGNWLIDPTDFTVAAGSAALTTSGIGADTLSTSLGSSNVTITTDNVNGTDAGDINLNAAVSWAANKLTLSAYNNININAPLNGSGTASLALEYGQGALAAGNTSSYNIKAPVSLPAGDNFSTKQGSDGAVLGWKVITDLGAAGSTTGADLQGINGGLTGRYVLGADIDATATAGWNAGAGFAPIGNSPIAIRFNGSFDGLGHTISHLTINRPATNNVGLFGYTGSSTVVRNLGLVNANVTGNTSVGALVGNNQSGTLSNSYATGSVTGANSVGGLVGNNQSGTLSNSYAGTIVVRGNLAVGGLVGNNQSGTISNSYATGSVTGMFFVGGLLGNTNGGSVSNSYATASVSGTGDYVGGLVGYNNGGSLSNSYAAGRVSGRTKVGGLVGARRDGTITNSFWDTTTSPGLLDGIGAGDLTGATGLTTAELAAALPTGFSASVWGNGDNQTTPYLLSHSVFAATSGSVILGSDTSATPTAYQVILNATQLQNINTTGLAGSYVLGSNVDATATAGLNAGAGFAPIGTFEMVGLSVDPTKAFTGSFDGLGHSISNLMIYRPATDNVGLFGYTHTSTVVRNLGLVNANVTGQTNVGALVGYSFGTTINNSYASGLVYGVNSYVGGLAGSSNDGLAISNSYFSGSVTSDSQSVGGLVGFLANGSVSNSYATGSVKGEYRVGGLVGFSDNSSISRSYASGTVLGDYTTGGVVGENYASNTYTANFWDTEKSGLENGLGSYAEDPTVVGLTTAQMQTGANFTDATAANGYADPNKPDWDFANTWVIYEGHTSPLLRSFMTPLTVTANSGTKVYGGSTTYLGGTASYSVTPDTRLLGTVTYTQSSKDVGSRTITPSGQWSDQQGYLISYASGSLTVDKATLTATASASNKDYNGNTTAAVSLGSLIGLVNSETLNTTAEGTFDTKDVGTGKMVTVNSLTLLDGTNGGLASNYQLASGQTTTANITPKSITVTADAKSKVYGEADPALTYTVTSGSVVNSDSLGSLTRTAGENVGSYTINASALANGNYLITANDGALSISQRPAAPLSSSLPVQVVGTVAQLFDSVVARPSFIPLRVQQPFSTGTTASSGFTVVGDGVQLPSTLIDSFQ